jgi:hypothetical protein
LRKQPVDKAAYEAGLTGKKDQFIKWNDPHWVDAGVRSFLTDLKWVGDGQTLELHPGYEGEHSSAPILVKNVSGPLVATGPNTLRLQLDALSPDAGRATFVAYSVGDAEYRYTEKVGMMPRGWKGFSNGKPQTITFPPIGKDLELKATSDAGLPMEYYVASGPAVVVGGKLKIEDLPARAKFPMTVRVVAYQMGRGIEPLVQTAKPVEQTIQIERP